MEVDKTRIYKSCFELSKALIEIQGTMEKSIQYGEFKNVVSFSCKALDHIYLAYVTKENKEEEIDEILRYMHGIKFRIRLFCEAKKISVKKTAHIARMVDDVTKQAIGWKRSTMRQGRESNGNASERSSIRYENGLPLHDNNGDKGLKNNSSSKQNPV